MTEITEYYEQEALTLADQARSLQVVDQESYNAAGARLLAVAALRKKIVDHHKPLKEKTRAAWMAVVDAEKKLLTPVEEAEGIYKNRISSWEVRQRVIEAERRARAEAEARRLAEELRERELEEAEQQGADAVEIQAMAAAPLPMVMPSVEPSYQRAQGISMATTWKGEVTSLAALVKAIAEGNADLHLVKADEPAINEKARRTRGTLQIPGLRFYEVSTMKTTGRK